MWFYNRVPRRLFAVVVVCAVFFGVSGTSAQAVSTRPTVAMVVAAKADVFQPSPECTYGNNEVLCTATAKQAGSNPIHSVLIQASTTLSALVFTFKNYSTGYEQEEYVGFTDLSTGVQHDQWPNWKTANPPPIVYPVSPGTYQGEVSITEGSSLAFDGTFQIVVTSPPPPSATVTVSCKLVTASVQNAATPSVVLYNPAEQKSVDVSLVNGLGSAVLPHDNEMTSNNWYIVTVTSAGGSIPVSIVDVGYPPAKGNSVYEGCGEPEPVQVAQGFDNSYAIATQHGTVYSFTEGFGRRTISVTPPISVPVVGVAEDPLTGGFWLAANNGGVRDINAPSLGAKPHAGRVIVGIAATPTGKGYWLVTQKGNVLAYGDARMYGSATRISTHRVIVGIAATPTGKGYWLVTQKGNVLAYGDARMYGSATGKISSNDLVVGIAATPTGKGYRIVTLHGHVFAYGDAMFSGVVNEMNPNRFFVGIATDCQTDGYWLFTRNGTVFAVDAPNIGSLSQAPSRKIVAVTSPS
jgi:hypothetical protein